MDTAVQTIAAETFADLMLQRRQELGLSQEALARALGDISLRSVAGWEAGRSIPRADHYIQLCILLDIDPTTAYRADTRVLRATPKRKT